jgi:predicted PurR-regulated permease PerM
MELIPYIGPTLAAVPAIIIGMLHSWESAVFITLMYLVIQQIEGNLLIPRIVGETVNIHPAILMVVLLALAQFGFIWIVVSAPLAAILRDIFLYVYGRVNDPPRPAGLLPGDEPIEEGAHAQAVESGPLSPEVSEG